MPSVQNVFIDKMMVDVRPMHKAVNKLLKNYNMLQNTYRGQLEKHHYEFGAVANLVQMKIENEEMTIFQLFWRITEITNHSFQKKEGWWWVEL